MTKNLLGYLQQLRNNVVSGLSNTHNIITVSMLTLSGLSFIIIHFVSIFNNRKIREVENTEDLPPPASIIYLSYKAGKIKFVQYSFQIINILIKFLLSSLLFSCSW